MCFWMKSKLSSKNAFLSPCNIKSTLLTTTMIGIPKLTCRQPSGNSNSSLKSTSTSSSYSSESDAALSFYYCFIQTFGSAFRALIKFPISSSFGSSYVFQSFTTFCFIFSYYPGSSQGVNLNSSFYNALIHFFNWVISSQGCSKSNIITTAIDCKVDGFRAASRISIYSHSCTLHMFNFGKLSSEVICELRLSLSVKSFTYRKEKSNTAKSEFILSSAMTLFFPSTCFQLIAFMSDRLPAPLSPNKTTVPSCYDSRFPTSLRILFQIPSPDDAPFPV